MTRYLIVTAIDLGVTQATTSGGRAAMAQKVATAARIVVPGPWVREVVQRYRGEDLGVELTLISDDPILRIGPITHAPSLLAGDGGFPATINDLFEHADPDEVHHELRAQIERAVLWGIGVTHLGVYQDSLWYRPEFFDIVVDLALDFHLPLRLAADMNESWLGYDAYELARARGATLINHFVRIAPACYESPTTLLEGITKGLDSAPNSGISELSLVFAYDTPEYRALSPSRGCAPICLVEQPQLLDSLIHRLGFTPIGYRGLSAVVNA
ncbi:MAG: ChbG/HpnK family deacetylase [Ferrimicrobium sp.]